MARKSAICKWIIFAISSFAIVEKKPFATNGFLFLDWTAKYIYYKKETLFLLSSTKTLPTHEKKKKKLFRSCKMEKKPSNNGKKRNSFTLEKLLIYFFLQIKFAFRKDPSKFHNQ